MQKKIFCWISVVYISFRSVCKRMTLAFCTWISNKKFILNWPMGYWKTSTLLYQPNYWLQEYLPKLSKIDNLSGQYVLIDNFIFNSEPYNLYKYVISKITGLFYSKSIRNEKRSFRTIICAFICHIYMHLFICFPFILLKFKNFFDSSDIF